MRTRLSTLFVMMALLAPGWGQPKELKAEWVEIMVRPEAGRAGCRYQPDGHMKGYHISGPPAVRVFEAEGKLENKLSLEVFDSARKLLGRGLLRANADTNQSSQNYLIVGASDGTTYSTSWKFQEKPSDPGAGKLAELLLNHHVGGW